METKSIFYITIVAFSLSRINSFDNTSIRCVGNKVLDEKNLTFIIYLFIM